MSHDSFLFLEDLNHSETQSFLQQAQQRIQSVFPKNPKFSEIKQDIIQTLQDEKQIPFCQEHRARMYHFHQSAEFPKGVYRVCSASSYRSGLPEWKILFSVADFDDILQDDVYLEGVSHYVDEPKQVLLTLSSAGSDSAYTIEFNLKNQKIVEKGFHFPNAKNHIAWRDADSVWVCPAWDESQLTHSGYPRQVWLMKRGQTFEEAQFIYEMPQDAMMVHAWRYLDGQGAPIDLMEAAHSFFQKDYFQIHANGEISALNLPQDIEIVGYLAGQLLLKLNSDWQRANQKYHSGSLLAVKLNRGQIGSAHVLFEPKSHQALESIETTKRFVIANILDNVSSQLKTWKWENQSFVEYDLPKLPNGAMEFIDQPWGGDVVYLASSDFITPLTLFSLDLNVMELSVLRRQPKQFNTQDIEIQQFWVKSEDGTNIPYYRVGKPNAELTLVYVYGGFNIAQLPYYMGLIGRHWLEKGNAFVLANVRGGGEFSDWHTCAQRENKHKSVDDLLAILADLVKRGLAKNEQIAIQGGSNGGLVVASAFVREPQTMGAMVCEVPLTDMLRYTQLYAGASWIDEYGDPNDEHDEKMRVYWEKFSPYHQLDKLTKETKTKLPAALLTTSLTDDRVHPSHALKFYAKLNKINPDKTWLYAQENGGHTGNSTQEQNADSLAMILIFLETVLMKS